MPRAIPAPTRAVIATRVIEARMRVSSPGFGRVGATGAAATCARCTLRARLRSLHPSRGARWGTAASVAGFSSPLRASRVATAIEPPTTTRVSTTVDTTSATLPVAPPEPPIEPPSGRAPRWPWVLAVLAFLAVSVFVAGLVVTLPYYALGPGGARATEPTIAVEGAPTYPAGDDLLFTTVLLDRVNAFELLAGWLSPDTDIVPAEEIDGDQTPEENRQFNQQLMDVSQDTAVVVALEHLGFDVVSGTGATIGDIVPDAPADGVLEAGDTVVRLDGEPVERREDLVAVIDAMAPGDELEMVVEDEEGDRRRVTVTLGAFPDFPDEPFLGVSGLETRDLELDYPFEVTIDPGQVRGPSAGLAFTLAVLDVLTPGDLSNGVPVAVTGTIDGLGRVGPVGGVEFKALAAERAGAELFLVPAGEEEQARSRVGDDLEVVPVATLDDALVALDELGGGALDLEMPGVSVPEA